MITKSNVCYLERLFFVFGTTRLLVFLNQFKFYVSSMPENFQNTQIFTNTIIQDVDIGTQTKKKFAGLSI